MLLQIDGLCKTISGIQVLKDISLHLYGGKIYGLSGKNGSGKTMLMRAICGLIKPSRGEIRIDGKRLGKDMSFPKSVGALIEMPSFIMKYTGLKNLKILADIQGKTDGSEVREILLRVGLDPDDKRSYRKYSLGMKQRLGIACALMEKPEIILLDEPINALDEGGVVLTNTLLQEARSRGALIILSAHDRQELELLSDELYVMAEGKITEHKILCKKEEG